MGPAWRGSSVSLGDGGRSWAAAAAPVGADWRHRGGCRSTATVAGLCLRRRRVRCRSLAAGPRHPSDGRRWLGRLFTHQQRMAGNGWLVATSPPFIMVVVLVSPRWWARGLSGACCGAVVVLQCAPSLSRWRCCGGGGVGFFHDHERTAGGVQSGESLHGLMVA
jgi:hypothetical protein